MRRTLTAALAALALAASTGSTPAAADEVTTAQARVDALQAVAAKSTRQLEDGTRAWEADQAALRKVELRLLSSGRKIAAAQATADAATAKVDALARDLYRSPYGRGGSQLVFAASPDAFVEAAHALEAVDHAAGSQDRILADARTARLRLQTEQRSVEAARDEAARLAARSQERLADLRALAERTAAELEAAQTALVKAKDRAAARAKAARASRLRSLSSGGAFCTGKSTAGQSNGNLDPASLCPLWMAPGHRLVGPAAKAFNAMSQAYAADRGTPLCVTDSYRSYSEQAALYRRKPGLAAVPGKSEHGWGKAVDFCGGVQDFDSAAHQWMKDNAGRFGWYHPDWARRGGSRPEAWHWEYGG